MTKQIPFYQTLNQAPRSAKHRGKHRRAGAPAHGRSFDGTDYGTRADFTGVTVRYTSFNTVSTTVSTNDIADPWFTKPEPPAIPYAGIRAGELIGHRLWWLIDGQLCSLAHRRIWQPGETVAGDTQKLVNDWSFLLGPNIWGGTYAFFSAEQMGGEIKDCLEAIQSSNDTRQRLAGMSALLSPLFWRGSLEAGGVVAGTIKMWGEVIEHERGYRAEFAKLNSIDAIHGEGDIDELRLRYGVT
jgi:hypothetical protein